MSDLLTRIDRPGNDRFDVPAGRWYTMSDGDIGLEVETGIAEEDLAWSTVAHIQPTSQIVANRSRKPAFRLILGDNETILTGHGYWVGNYLTLDDAKKALLEKLPRRIVETAANEV